LGLRADMVGGDVSIATTARTTTHPHLKQHTQEHQNSTKSSKPWPQFTASSLPTGNSSTRS
jgi:hypothetical protein